MKHTQILDRLRNRILQPAIVGACLAAAATLGGLPHAQAANLYQFQDNLDGDPSVDWSFFNSTISSFGHVENGPAARTGNGDGFMFMNGRSTDWSSFGRQVNISVVFPGAPQRTCVAQVYVAGFRAHGQLEVIDVTTWTYVSIKPFDINNTTYLPVTTDAFIPARPGIFVRVVLIGNLVSQSARIDDLTVQCAS
jgi:hypothetical protein